MVVLTSPSSLPPGPMTTAMLGKSVASPPKNTSSAPSPIAASDSATADSGSTPSDTSSLPPGAFSDMQNALLTSIKQLKAIEAEPGPNPPPTLDLPPPPVQAPYNPIHSWGSTAMVLAMIGSAFTRHPLTAALNSGSQVMKAYNDGNAEAAANATDQWKTNTANALKLYQYEQDAYSKAIQAHQDNERDALMAVTVQAAAFKDGPMSAAAETGGLPAVIQMYQKRGKAAASLAGQTGTLSQEDMRQQTGDASRDAYLNNPYSDQIPAYVLNGFDKRYAPIMNYGTKSSDVAVFNQGVQEFMKGYGLNPIQLSSRRSVVAALNSSISKMTAQQEQAKASSQTFSQQWDYIQNNLLSKGAPSSNIGPILNDYLQSGSISSGDPNTVAYVTALGTLAEEYAKVISGATGAAGSTVNAQEFARTLFRGGYSKEQITAAIHAAQANMAAREQQYPKVIGQMQDWISSIPSDSNSQPPQQTGDGGGDAESGDDGGSSSPEPTPSAVSTPSAVPTPSTVPKAGSTLHYDAQGNLVP